jgi:hypothetical protein
LANQGRFDPSVLSKIAHPEQFPAILSPLLQLFLRLPVAHFYFDTMLKQNGANDQRIAQPLSPEEQV